MLKPIRGVQMAEACGRNVEAAYKAVGFDVARMRADGPHTGAAKLEAWVAKAADRKSGRPRAQAVLLEGALTTLVDGSPSARRPR